MHKAAISDIRGLSIIAVAGMLWYVLGVAAFLIALMTSREGLEAAGTNALQIEYIFSTPLWAKIANAVAVFAGFLGSIALLMRRRLAYYLFALTLLAVMAVMLDAIFRNGFAYLGPVNNAISLAVTVIALILFWIAHYTNLKGLLQ